MIVEKAAEFETAIARSGARAGYRRELRSITAFAFSFAAVLIGIVSTVLWVERNKAIEASEIELKSLAIAQAEISARTFEGVDYLLRAAIDFIVVGELTREEHAEQVHAVLRERVAGSHILHAITVIDASGQLVAQSRPGPLPNINIADREHFNALKDSSLTLTVGTPGFSRATGEWSLFFVRRLVDQYGEFAGAVAAVIDPAYFEHVYASIIGRRGDGSTELIREDGVLLARYLAVPQAQAYTASDPEVRARIAGTSEPVVLRGRWGNDGASRIVVAMKLPGLPVYLATSEREDRALVDWRERAILLSSVTFGVLLALGLMTLLLYRQVAERERAHREGDRQSRQQTELLRAIIENMPIGVSVVDPELRLLAFNTHFLDLLDLRGINLRPGDTLESVFRYNATRGEYGPGDIEEQVQSRLALARHPTAHQFERRRPSGQAIDIRGRPLADGTMVTTYIDVTARARTEAELRAAKDAAEMANRAKSVFLASMSHELRTPLNAVIGFTEFIAKESFGSIPSRYVEYAGDVLAAARHLLSVINDILDMSKIEAGRYELNLRTLRLSTVIARSLSIARGIAAEKAIEIETHIDPEVPEIVADERAIKQVLLNLLSNAIKFNDSGGRIVLSLRGENDSWQEIKIADTGIGISAQAMRNLFEPFARGEADQSRPGEGTGLGLWISREFVVMHGGTLDLESYPNIGTTATVRLPVHPPAPE